VGCGRADWTGISALTERDALISPNPSNRQIYDSGYARFRNLYERLEGSSA
jgi:xylulokinase